MNLSKASAFLACAAASLLAQSCVQYAPDAGYPPPPQPPTYATQYAPPPPSEPPPQEPAPAPFVGADDALVAPIALYPDPLIALILPASTAPGDLSAAASYLVQYGDVTRIDSQPWDPSVRGLAHYPTVVSWMAENMPWTQALGSAFLSSPSDVMEAIQRMRARARAAGNLVSTPQQQVYEDDGQIDIYPAQPDAVYVPAYDDSVVYSEGPAYGYDGPFISYGDPYPAGAWMSFYFDWHSHRVWSGDRNVWHEHGGWQPPRGGGDRSPPGAHPWHPPSDVHGAPPSGRPGTTPPHPRPMPRAPNPPPVQNRRPAPPQGQANPPAPRSAPPPQERPRLNPSAPSPGAPARPNEYENRATPPPRTSEPERPRPNSPAPAPGSQGRTAEPQPRSAPPVAQPRPEPGYTSRQQSPSAQPPRQNFQGQQRPAPAPEPHAAPAREPAPAPAPAQDNGKQEPPR